MRWLSGEYTNRHCNWQSTFQTLAARPHRPPPPDQPPADIPRAFRIMSQGVPLAGRFISNMSDIHERNHYNNHPAVLDHADNVAQKFAKEEAKSFHIHLPRIFIYYIAGVLINPLQWAMRKGKGRICVDCTHARNPAGSPNSYTYLRRQLTTRMNVRPSIMALHSKDSLLVSGACVYRDHRLTSFNIAMILTLLFVEFSIIRIWRPSLRTFFSTICWYQWVKFSAVAAPLPISALPQICAPSWRLHTNSYNQVNLWNRWPLKQ